MEQAKRYRKKPVIVEAMLYIRPYMREVLGFAGDSVKAVMPDGRISLATKEGTLFVKPGAWIVKGIQGEMYPVAPEIFDATYEEVG